jgi:hypothetical protein
MKPKTLLKIKSLRGYDEIKCWKPESYTSPENKIGYIKNNEFVIYIRHWKKEKNWIIVISKYGLCEIYIGNVVKVST